MYQIETGERFFKKYKELNDYKGSPKDFLKEILFPLLYVEDRHLICVINDPFFVGKKAYNKSKNPKVISETAPQNYFSRLEKKDTSMTTTIGGHPTSNLATTSGQKPEYMELDEDSICFSYIGESLTLCINGGYSIAFFNESLLMTIFDGIKEYRKFVEENRDFKDSQIKTWNTIYLMSILKDCSIQELLANYREDKITKGKTVRMLTTVNWVDLFSELSISEYKIDMISVSNLGQTNETYGLITVDFENVKSFKDFYRKIYDNDFLLKNQKLIHEYLTHNKYFINFLKQPKIGSKMFYQEDYQKSDIEKKNFNKEIYFKNKKISAMTELNNTDAFKSAEQLAKILKEYKAIDKGSLRTNIAKVDDFSKSKSKTEVIKALSVIIKDFDEQKKESVKEFIKKMDSMDNNKFNYFLSLVNINIEL